MPWQYIEGSYLLGPNQVNGKAYWIQKEGSSAIWYSFGIWCIGLKKNLGSDSIQAYSPDDVIGPLETTTWKYMVNGNGKWIPTTDIVIQSGTYLPNANVC